MPAQEEVCSAIKRRARVARAKGRRPQKGWTSDPLQLCPLAFVPYTALESCKGSSRSLTFTQQTRTAKARGTQERGTHWLDPVLKGGPCYMMGLPPETNTGGDIHSAQTSGVLGLSRCKSWEKPTRETKERQTSICLKQKYGMV